MKLPQTVFITGATSGIGKACAESFAKLGYNLVITARRLDRLNTLSKELSSLFGIKCMPYELDVTKKEQVDSVFKQLESNGVEIDILVNNAGLALGLDKLQDGHIDNWDTMIDTNVKGLLYVTRAALPQMVKRDQGHIINMGSIAGHDTYPSGNVYCATKFAVRAISKSLRLDLHGTSIRVSEIAPGAVETEFSKVRFKGSERAEKTYQGYKPLSAEDIADAVIYCATRPQHVNISEIVLTPQAQSSIREIYKK